MFLPKVESRVRVKSKEFDERGANRLMSVKFVANVELKKQRNMVNEH